MVLAGQEPGANRHEVVVELWAGAVVSSEGWIVGGGEGVGGWTVGGLQAPSSPVGGFSPLSWEPLPSAASQQDRGFPRRARESNLHCPFCSLQMWGVLPRIGKGGSGRGHQERPPLQGDRPPWAAAVIKDCAPMSWSERRVRGRARWPLPGPHCCFHV